MIMRNNKKWFLAVGVAAMIAVNGFMAFAATPEQQDGANPKPPCVAADGKFTPDRNGFREHHAKLLELLKIDDATFRADMHAGKTLAAIAKEHGVSEQTLKDFIIKDMTQRIEEGVQAGRISADKAEKMKSDMDKRVTDMINGKGPMHHGPRLGHGLFDNPNLLALLKVDAEQLRTEMCAGKTLAAVADEHGVSAQELKDFMVKDFTDRIDADVTAGRLSADRAEQMKANLDAHVTDMINGKAFKHHGHGPGPMPQPNEPDQAKQSN